VYVTEVSSISCQWGCRALVGPAEKSLPSIRCRNLDSRVSVP
jgi:hypothetical protein